jgi:hypothetical protein
VHDCERTHVAAAERGLPHVAALLLTLCGLALVLRMVRAAIWLAVMAVLLLAFEPLIQPIVEELADFALDQGIAWVEELPVWIIAIVGSLLALMVLAGSRASGWSFLFDAEPPLVASPVRAFICLLYLSVLCSCGVRIVMTFVIAPILGICRADISESTGARACASRIYVFSLFLLFRCSLGYSSTKARWHGDACICLLPFRWVITQGHFLAIAGIALWLALTERQVCQFVCALKAWNAKERNAADEVMSEGSESNQISGGTMAEKKIVETIYGKYSRYDVVKRTSLIFPPEFYLYRDGKYFKGSYSSLADAVRAAQKAAGQS